MRNRGIRWWLLILALLCVATYVWTREDEFATPGQGVSREAAHDAKPARLRGDVDRAPVDSDVPPIVRGLVVHAGSGEPVPDVPVLVCSVREWWEKRSGHPVLTRVRSGADGSFVVSELPADVDDHHLYLVPWGGGWVPAPGKDGKGFLGDADGLIERGEGTVADVRLAVVASPRVEGRVFLPGGEPAPGAVVRPALTRWNDPMSPVRPFDFRYLVEPARTGIDGTFVLETVPVQENARFEVLLEGFSRVVSDAVRVAVGETTTMLTLHLSDPRAASWEVVSSRTGAPIPGAIITVLEYQPRARGKVRFFGRTDETGHAILSPFPAAVSRVTVEANGFLPYEYRRRDGTGSVLVESADGNLRAHVELEPAAWVSGRVLLPAGLEDAPFEPSIYVSIRALDAPGYEGYRVHDHDARTVDARWLEADGRFRMPVPPTGVYVLEAILDGFRLWEAASVEVVPGQEDVEVRVEIEESVPPPEELSTWVLDLRGPDGEPVEDAELRVTLDSGWDEARLYSGSPWAEVSRDADGTWRIPIATDYPPIWIDVRARLADGSSTGRKTFGPFAATGGRRRLDLPPPGTIAGRVLAPDGAGLGGAKVWATSVPPSGDRTVSSRRSHEVQTRCDDQGRFAFADLGQARYRLRVWEEGAWLAPDYAFVPCGAEDVVLQAHPSVASTVTVLDPDGVPLARCWVEVVARFGPRGDRAPLVGCTTRTGSDGRARLERLEAGATYQLWVSPGDDDLRFFDLEGWTPEDTTVRLKRWGHVAGKVVDREGAPLARVHVGFRDSAGEWFTRGTSHKGEFSIRELAPGAARIVAAWGKMKPEDLETSGAVEVETGTTDLVLVLPSLRELVVDVTGLRTRRPPDLTAHLWPLDAHGPRIGESREAEIDRASTLRFRGLEPGGRYLLWGRVAKLDRYVLAEVPAGATRPSVPFRKGGRIEGRVLLPEGTEARVHVWLRVHGLWVPADVDERVGTFTIRAVPEGTWTVEAHLGKGETRRTVTAEARAGGRVILDLRAP